MRTTLIVLSALLASCGGGGGGGSTPSPPPPSNTAPVAQGKVATSGQLIVGRTIEFDGSESYDTDNDPLQYRWELIETPAGSQIAKSYSGLRPSIRFDVQGVYRVRLTVNDGRAQASFDLSAIDIEEYSVIAFESFGAQWSRAHIDTVSGIVATAGTGSDTVVIDMENAVSVIGSGFTFDISSGGDKIAFTTPNPNGTNFLDVTDIASGNIETVTGTAERGAFFSDEGAALSINKEGNFDVARGQNRLYELRQNNGIFTLNSFRISPAGLNLLKTVTFDQLTLSDNYCRKFWLSPASDRLILDCGLIFNLSSNIADDLVQDGEVPLPANERIDGAAFTANYIVTQSDVDQGGLITTTFLTVFDGTTLEKLGTYPLDRRELPVGETWYVENVFSAQAGDYIRVVTRNSFNGSSSARNLLTIYEDAFSTVE